MFCSLFCILLANQSEVVFGIATVDSLRDNRDTIYLIRFRNDQVPLHVPFVTLPHISHFLKLSRH